MWVLNPGMVFTWLLEQVGSEGRAWGLLEHVGAECFLNKVTVHLLGLLFIFIGAGGSDPEFGTILMLSRDQSMCPCMSEIPVAERSLWVPRVVRTRFSLSRHGDINIVSVLLQALTLAIVMYKPWGQNGIKPEVFLARHLYFRWQQASMSV